MKDDAEKLLQQFNNDQAEAGSDGIANVLVAFYNGLTRAGGLPAETAAAIVLQHHRLILIKTLWQNTAPDVEL